MSINGDPTAAGNWWRLATDPYAARITAVADVVRVRWAAQRVLARGVVGGMSIGNGRLMQVWPRDLDNVLLPVSSTARPARADAALVVG
jgi:hypothetical protein